MTSHLLLSAAIRANVVVIRQGIGLLAELGPERYPQRAPLCFNASIGGHTRHIVEHYQSFLRGLTTGEIDYEDRPRDARVEGDVAYASGLLESICDQLEELAGNLANRGLALRAETMPGLGTATSVLRELEFLLSHTIHHYALVAVMARLQGCEPGPAFGVAPSTLKYQQTQAVCAP